MAIEGKPLITKSICYIFAYFFVLKYCLQLILFFVILVRPPPPLPSNICLLVRFLSASSCPVVLLQYVPEVVTLHKKYLIYLQQKMRFTPVINYYNTLGLILFVHRAK